jgi:hypothetical protein
VLGGGGRLVGNAGGGTAAAAGAAAASSSKTAASSSTAGLAWPWRPRGGFLCCMARWQRLPPPSEGVPAGVRRRRGPASGALTDRHWGTTVSPAAETNQPLLGGVTRAKRHTPLVAVGRFVCLRLLLRGTTSKTGRKHAPTVQFTGHMLGQAPPALLASATAPPLLLTVAPHWAWEGTGC